MPSAENTEQHNHYTHQENEQRDAVHAVHERGIYVSRVIGVALADIKISQYLVPESGFHSAIFCLKLWIFYETDACFISIPK